MTDIRNQTIENILQWVSDTQQPRFRAKQIYDWLWKKGANSFEQMTDLPKSLRENLENDFVIQSINLDTTQISKIDKTIKNRYTTFDGHRIEGVLIPAPKHDLITACVSSQIGCSLSCKFCATGKLDRIRNLKPDEIFDQFTHINQQAIQYYGKGLSNVVFMGMGEPLLNYKNVMQGIQRITQFGDYGFSPKRITVSTAGIAKMIHQLAKDKVHFNLALSLHAANDSKRSEIMPINESNTLEALIVALRDFYESTGNQITLEYILLNRFNDDELDAEELAAFAKQIPCKINIIEYNSIGDGLFAASNEKQLNQFLKVLTHHRLIVNVRRSKGKDIDAACGQLANK